MKLFKFWVIWLLFCINIAIIIVLNLTTLPFWLIHEVTKYPIRRCARAYDRLKEEMVNDKKIS